MVAKEDSVGEAESAATDVRDGSVSFTPRPSMVVKKGPAGSDDDPRKRWHDYRNILTPIEGYLSLAAHHCVALLSQDISPEIRDALLQIRDSVAKAASGLDNLKNYHKPPELQTLDFSRILEEVIECRLQAWATEGVQMKVEAGITPGLQIAGYHHDLRQTLSNLLNNAFDACGGISGREPIIAVTLARAGANVRCVIRDNGHGMSEEVKKFAGTEGFTTKEKGSGLGIKLSIDRLRKIGGSIAIADNRDEGGQKTDGISAIVEIPAVVADQESR